MSNVFQGIGNVGAPPCLTKRCGLQLNADHLFLSLARLAEVRFKAHREAAGGGR